MMEGGTSSNHSLCCSSVDLRWFADQLGHDSRRISSALGIEPPEIERLKGNYPRQVEEQIFQMLVGYRQKQGSKTYSGLYNAFNKCGRSDIADKLETCMKQCQQMQNIPSSSTNELTDQQINDTLSIASIEKDTEKKDTEKKDTEKKDTEKKDTEENLLQHSSRCMFIDKEPMQPKSSRSSSEHSKDRDTLSFIPIDLDFRFLKDDIGGAITPKDLNRLKKVVLADKTRGIHCGIEAAQLLNIKTGEDFLRCLETLNLFGEDNLYFIQFLMHKLKKQDILQSIEEYAQKRSTQPIVLAKIKRRRPGKGSKYVEFRIKGHVRHLKFSDVDKFRKVISKNLNIPSRYINLVGIGRGSVILVFQIPNTGVERLRNSLKMRDAWLQEKDILGVHIDGDNNIQIQKDNHDDDDDTSGDGAASVSNNFETPVIQSVHTDDRSMSYVEESVRVGKGFETPDDFKKGKIQKGQTVAEEEPNDTKRLKLSSKEKPSISIVEPHQSILTDLPLSDEILLQVATTIDPHKMTAIGINLQFSCAQIKQFQYNHQRNVLQAIIDMLHQWRNENENTAGGATQEVLVNALREAECNIAATQLEQAKCASKAGQDEGINVNMRPGRGKSSATQEQKPTGVSETDDAHPKGVQTNLDDGSQSIHTDDRRSDVENSLSIGNDVKKPDNDTKRIKISSKEITSISIVEPHQSIYVFKKDTIQKRQTVAEEEPNDTKRIKISLKEITSISIDEPHQSIFIHDDDMSSDCEESVSNDLETPDVFKKDTIQKRQTVAEEEPNDTKRTKISSKEITSISIVEPHQSIFIQSIHNDDTSCDGEESVSKLASRHQIISKKDNIQKRQPVEEEESNDIKRIKISLKEITSISIGEPHQSISCQVQVVGMRTDMGTSYDSYHASKEQEQSRRSDDSLPEKDAESYLGNADLHRESNRRPDTGKSYDLFHTSKEESTERSEMNDSQSGKEDQSFLDTAGPGELINVNMRPDRGQFTGPNSRKWTNFSPGLNLD